MAPPALPDSQNAALVYKQAAKSLRLSPAQKTAFNTRERSRTPEQQKTIEAALRKNQKALDLTRRAAAMPQCRFPLNYQTDNPVTLLFPHYGEVRELARLLAAQAKLESKNRNVTAALGDVRALFGMSHHLSNEFTLIGFLVAQSLDATAHQTLAQALESGPLTSSQAREFQISLPATDWSRSFQKCLLGDRAFGLSIFDRLTRLTITSEDLSLLGGSPPFLWNSYPLLFLWRPMLKLDEVQYLRLWKPQIAATLAPQISTRSQTMQAGDRAVENLPSYAAMSRTLYPVFSSASIFRDAAEVRRRQREIALVLAVYRTANGHYPAQLAGITDLAGKALPLDPYSQKPFVYRREGESFVLYSVSLNQADDGGENSGLSPSNTVQDDLLWSNPFKGSFRLATP
ncbi:MAG TPA: hypothetical protein VF627_13725 [Abditibacterium sp.]